MIVRFACMGLAILLFALPASAQQADCVPIGWDRFLAPGPQEFAHREAIALDGGAEIQVFEFADLKGDYAKLFIFIRYEDRCMKKVVSLGSYAATNALAAAGSRTYHLDLYERDMHATLGFFDEIPDYGTLRARALEVLQ